MRKIPPGRELRFWLWMRRERSIKGISFGEYPTEEFDQLWAEFEKHELLEAIVGGGR